MRVSSVIALALASFFAAAVPARAAGPVVINEISWMGTTYSTNDEWIELYNDTGVPVSLAGWTLKAADGTPSITLTGSIPAYGFFLLERTADATVPGITANQIYTGALSNTVEDLQLKNGATLVDAVPAWYAGNNTTKATMSRAGASQAGNVASNWLTAVAAYNGGLGTPKAANLAGGGSASWYAVHFTDHLNTVMPTYGPKAMAKALTAAINSATTSIDFAVYGFNGNEDLIEALFAAKDRGVIVRGVLDTYASGFFPYRSSEFVKNYLGTVVTDNDDRIMHNKFFVFDGRRVWTGSTNLSRPEMDTEYYGDISVLIDHQALAQAYKTEFEEMYSGKFHDLKTDNTPHTFPVLADGSVIESYFAPTDNSLTNGIVKAINKARTKIDMRAFYLSSQEVIDALLAAKGRGVSIRLILDAESARGGYSLHAQLRSAGISVKVENWAGTEHNKTFAVDDYIVVLGSQNFTFSGNTASDENLLYIENRPLAASYKSRFDTAWASIPAQWLNADPDPESTDSPGSLTDLLDNDHDGNTDEGAAESINTVQTGDGAITTYFLRQIVPQAASAANLANFNVNLENKLVARINGATATIDLATYELTLPGVVDALLARAAAGVRVRFIADGKSEVDDEGLIDNSYQKARLYYERLVRGGVQVYADSPIFAVTDAALRAAQGLPATPALPYVTLTVGTASRSGYLVANAEHKSATPTYFSPGDQMHNKFVIVDGTWVFTGSWNFTINDTFGSDANRAANFRNGNSNHALDIRSAALAAAYRTEFEEMWGGSAATPNPTASNFHSRKVDNTPHEFVIGGKRVRLYFSAGDNPMPNMAQIVATEANVSAHFSIFTWSDQALVDALKVLYEGSNQDLVGVRTGFDIKGIFEGSFWNQYWSASMDMTARIDPLHPTGYSTRWANVPPVFFDGEDKFLHHKYMILDVNTTSNPTVITGSTNWSANGNATNDENMLVIYDAAIANQFYQEFLARYYMAGGIVDVLMPP